MTFKILALFCLVSTIAASPVETELYDLDWSNIKPVNFRIEPIGPAIVESPKLRISGGSEAARNSVPYIVALIGDNSLFCGGAIIGKTWVLTTAICIDGATSVQIIAGAHNPRTTDNEPFQKIFVADHNDLFKHRDWVAGLMQNDIALVRQNNLHIEDAGISTVRLVASGAPALAGATASLSGWGSTNGSVSTIATYLQTAKLKIISNTECATSYGSQIQDQHMCTSGEGGSGACLGDSGSPLIDHDTFTATDLLVGLVSFAATPCGSGHPTVYTRMSYFRNWVKDITSI